MFLAIRPSQFNKHHIMLSEKTKNNVMEGGDFFRLYYSDTDSNSNGLFISFSFKDVCIEKYFNKIKCIFEESTNKDIIQQLKQIEKKNYQVCLHQTKRCYISH